MSDPNRKPRIAIPTPTSHDEDYNQRCWPEYAAAVEGVGGEPVRIPLTLDPAETANFASSCDAVLLPGSPADVHPQKYGQEALPATAAPDLAREATDELLLQDAFHLRKPVFGVCFGLQMLNVWRGGALVQELPQQGAHAAPAGKGLEHSLRLEPEGRLLRSFFLDRTDPRVNSSHHQAVGVAGDGLVIAARSAGDGLVEALEGSSPENQFVLGVQWHPERSYTSDEPSRAMFTAFIAAAHRWHLPQA